MSINSTSNEYANALGAKLLGDTPKLVFAAIAASMASGGGDRLDSAAEVVAWEWVCLHAAGIVPQQPPAHIRALAAEHERKQQEGR